MSFMFRIGFLLVLGFVVCDSKPVGNSTNESNGTKETAGNANTSSQHVTKIILTRKAASTRKKSAEHQILVPTSSVPSVVENSVAEETDLEKQTVAGNAAATPPPSLVETHVAESTDVEKQELLGIGAASPPPSPAETENREAASSDQKAADDGEPMLLETSQEAEKKAHTLVQTQPFGDVDPLDDPLERMLDLVCAVCGCVLGEEQSSGDRSEEEEQAPLQWEEYQAQGACFTWTKERLIAGGTRGEVEIWQVTPSAKDEEDEGAKDRVAKLMKRHGQFVLKAVSEGAEDVEDAADEIKRDVRILSKIRSKYRNSWKQQVVEMVDLDPTRHRNPFWYAMPEMKVLPEWWTAEKAKLKEEALDKCINKIAGEVVDRLIWFHGTFHHVHGDLKQENLLYKTHEGGCPTDLVLADFGRAYPIGTGEGSHKMDGFGKIGGYFPPIMFKNSSEAKPASASHEDGTKYMIVSDLDWCSTAFMFNNMFGINGVKILAESITAKDSEYVRTLAEGWKNTLDCGRFAKDFKHGAVMLTEPIKIELMEKT